MYFKGAVFYGPRLFWEHQEENKLTNMIGGVLKASKKAENDNEKKKDIERNCVSNVMNYIQMKKGGHWQYGTCYVLAQVSCKVNSSLQNNYMKIAIAIKAIVNTFYQSLGHACLKRYSSILVQRQSFGWRFY